MQAVKTRKDVGQLAKVIDWIGTIADDYKTSDVSINSIWDQIPNFRGVSIGHVHDAMTALMSVGIAYRTDSFGADVSMFDKRYRFEESSR